jgi:hypothetical protein
MSEKENIQFTEEAIAALNAHDINRYVQLIDEACVGESEIGPVLRMRGSAPEDGHASQSVP